MGVANQRQAGYNGLVSGSSDHCLAADGMNIKNATRRYEEWMRECRPVVEQHLRHKHAKMKLDPFQFFRGSYYRWAQIWTEVCPECAKTPKTLCVGDLHVDSFGTWRDAEGRLCWGVDDFDEAYPLPYANDLIRLAASVKIARKLGHLSVKTKAACEVILDSYRQSLASRGCPIVLAELETHLEKLGIDALKPPKDFWKKLNQHRTVRGNVPQEAKRCLTNALPDKNLHYRIIQREAGLGSLGQQRFVAIALCHGGYIAREAKRVVPSASVWLQGSVACRQPYYEAAMTSAVRSQDPYQRICESWLLRRLSPDSNPIKIEQLTGKRDEYTLLHAMGSEAANVHLGIRGKANVILRDLDRRKPAWLQDAARRMAEISWREWKQYRA
jgi:hypothetical protein